MPQMIAKIGRERSVKTLTRNLFVIDRQTDPKETKRAEAAILKANPHLETAGGFKSGATVVIPGNIGLRRTPRIQQPDVSLSGIVLEASQRLDLAQETLKSAFSETDKSISASLATLKNAKFKRVVAKQSEVGTELLNASSKNQSRQREINQKQEAELSEMIKDSQNELERLQKQIKESGF